ncbi:hypothetical protein ACKGJN_06965 [Gillisia sp. Q332]|uniref:glucosamine inositolphosphorylceramide transferase family protein n=1 Tax=Gillisia xinjiangensis TaxID=3384765 RepID=UPI00391B8DB7
MKKKIYFIFGIIALIVILILIIFNYRYPFVTPSVGNWSVGFSGSSELFSTIDVKPENIITYKSFDSLIPEGIDYIADPFYIKEDGVFYLFVELKGEGNANIALLTSTDGENYRYKGIVLDEDFHLSFPQVFNHKGEFYMLPETKGSNQVLLYKAENFPYDWRISDTLIKNRGLKDPSLLLSEELNLIVAVDNDLKQYMFTADSLNGSWTEAKNYKQRWAMRPGRVAGFLKWTITGTFPCKTELWVTARGSPFINWKPKTTGWNLRFRKRCI